MEGWVFEWLKIWRTLAGFSKIAYPSRTQHAVESLHSPLMEDCMRVETSQHRTSWETTVYSLPSSAYWYLMGGPGPSSRATSMKVPGTLSLSS